MAFYPIPFGHVEVHVDKRNPKPRRPRGGARRAD
jgi:hypothetical protein